MFVTGTNDLCFPDDFCLCIRRKKRSEEEEAHRMQGLTVKTDETLLLCQSVAGDAFEAPEILFRNVSHFQPHAGPVPVPLLRQKILMI